MSRLQAALGAARDTKVLEIGRGALARTPAVIREHFDARPAILIADPRTMDAAGYKVMSILAQAGMSGVEVVELRDPHLYAEHRFVEQVQSALAGRIEATPVAVGSGTINDLVKLASHRLGRAYLCVATAASMDGYTAYGASITYQGSKQTFECPAPRAVVADIDVIAAAPSHMTASGYADLMAKLTAGADWILAAALDVEPIDERAWTTVQSGLRDALAEPQACATGDASAIEKLTEGLMMGGFAMQAAQSSRPASGAEHQFSHLWDMQHHTHNGVAPSHGFKVGVATVAVARFYDALLAMDLSAMDIDRAVAAWPSRQQLENEIKSLFKNPEVLAVAMRESMAKYIGPDALRAQLQRVRDLWPALPGGLRGQLSAALPGRKGGELSPAQQLGSMLAAAGAPTKPEQIGISPARLRHSFYQAQHIRRRFTVLDLAVRANLMERCVEKLED